MPGRQGQAKGSKRTRFTKKRQPAPARKKRKPRAKPGDGTFSEAEVLKLAERGVESVHIARHLRLTGKLQSDPDLRAKFDEAVADGHATHCVQVAETLKEEAKKGRSNALRDVAKAWIPRYGDEVLTGEDEAGIIARVRELVAKLKKRKRAASASV